MEFKQFNTYMHQPDATYWQAALNTIPRKNLEKALFDFSFANGVLSGLEIIQAASPNLTVIIKAGRGVYRDTATGRAKVIEVHADYALDLTTHIPSGTATTIKIVASPSLNTTVETAITVNNALITHPDYDAGFTPYNFDPLERDDALIQVDSTPTAPQIVLGEVTLTAGQTQILNSHINLLNRDLGGFAVAVTKILSDYSALNLRLKSHIEAEIAHKAANISVTPIDGVAGEEVQSALTELRQQIAALETNGGKIVFLRKMPAGEYTNAEYVGDWSNASGLLPTFIQSQKIVGAAAGAGIDYVLPGLSEVPANSVIFMSALIYFDDYDWQGLHIGDDGDVYTLPAAVMAVRFNGAPPNTDLRNLIPDLTVDTEAYGLNTWFPVKISPMKTFALRVRSHASTSVATENCGWRLQLLAYTT